MPRYIDVEKINFKGADRYFDENNNTLVSLGEVMQIIKSTPTADVVEVVRCKDCKYSRPKNKSEKNIYFEDVIICESCEMADEPCAVLTNDFCSYGERKDGADND